MIDHIDLKTEAGYKFWTNDQVRFADLDPFNHLNNVTSAVYCENGRADFVTKLWPEHRLGKGTSWLLATLNLTFMRPVYYPSDILIGTRIQKIGNSSVTIGQGLFANRKCFTTAESVMVWADVEKEEAVSIPYEIRKQLLEYT